ncbi:MAG: hypothetical protein IIB76_08520 [Proteobacteria bacterium]|nr:hypothetical protein [Pseudomonadota bacterium]
MNEHKEIRDCNEADERFIAQAKAHFEDSVRSLDGATQSRLNQARQKALAETTTGAGFARWNQWVPVAGVAVAAVFAIVLWRGSPSLDERMPVTTTADFELLLNQDDFEMLEDFEFYSWIDIDDVGSNVG